MNILYRRISSIIFCLAFFLPVIKAEAATLYLLAEKRVLAIGEEFTLDIKTNTETTSVNAAQATIRFPGSVLELLSVDKTSSAFGFWVEEPKISNDDGTLSFTGGAAKGVAGESLQILKLKFKAKGAGQAEISLHDAAVTASDGKGTNVLSSLKGTSVTIATSILSTPILPPPSTPVKPSILAPVLNGQTKPIVVEEPKRVVREPARAESLPKKPELRMSLYPDESRWYNRLGEVIALWNVPNDVTEVATALNKAPLTRPTSPEKELFDGKNFGILEEGVWYIHVRFKNNVGWGETAHFKISIDTTAPLAFEIKMDVLASDNPTPEIQYETQDVFSGILHTLIFVDGKESIKSTTTAMKLPAQTPGKHILVARAFDLAGNSIEDELEFEILPLPDPTIDFITKTVSQGEAIFLSGKSLSNSFVDVKISNLNGREIFKGVAATDSAGKWEMTIGESLERGTYGLSVVARDERGATSYPTEPVSFSIKAKTVISLGSIDLGWLEIFVIAVLSFGLMVSIVTRRHIHTKQTHEAYGIIVSRDLDKFTTLLLGYLEELESLNGQRRPASGVKSVALVEKMKETVAKMRKYMTEEINKL